MLYIFLALLSFCACVGSHIHFCRSASKTVLHSKAFLGLVGCFLGIYAILCFLVPAPSPASVWGMPLKLTGGVLFVLCAPAYLTFYVLTQLMSPSKKILLVLRAQGGASYAQLVEAVRLEAFIDTRLNDLCASGCVIRQGDVCVLSPSGKSIAATLAFCQRLFGRNIGG